MSENKSSSSGAGIGFCSALGLLFIGLKLAEVIDWGWAWVLSPFWIPWAVLMVVLMVVGLAWTVLAIIEGVRGRIRRGW